MSRSGSPTAWAEKRERLASRLLLPALAFLAATIAPAQTGGQVIDGAYAIQYFLDEAPRNLSSLSLPAASRDVALAKVHLVGTVFWRGGRHPWDPPPARNTFGAELEVIEPISGNMTKGDRYIVSFGTPSLRQKYKYPVTPSMLTRDYFVVLYIDENNERQLVGFPVGREEYERWEREFFEHERERGRFGARDK